MPAMLPGRRCFACQMPAKHLSQRMQEQELVSLRTELAALKGSHRKSSLAAPAHCRIIETAPAPPLQGPKGAQQGKIVKEVSGGQSSGRDERMPADAEEEEVTSSPGRSQAEASLDRQSRLDTSKDQKPAGGTSKEASSLPQQPAAQQSSPSRAPVSGKRQRPLLPSLPSPKSQFQPAADTPDELEVGCLDL